MPLDLGTYATLVFDCDGVILDSNQIKTEAFRGIASRYGEAAASELVAYHQKHGGISRYRKFEHLFHGILGRAPQDGELASCLTAFAGSVHAELLSCDIAPGLQELRGVTPGASWMIVSGGDQAELREIFHQRSIAHLFDGGIFGSPTTKDEILRAQLGSGVLRQPGLLLGDSQLDYECARQAGLDFVFVHGWTEFVGWEAFFGGKDVHRIEHVAHVLRRNAELV